ncbi:hypothetical protein QF040_002751 [Variovorax sp. W2I14]
MKISPARSITRRCVPSKCTSIALAVLSVRRLPSASRRSRRSPVPVRCPAIQPRSPAISIACQPSQPAGTAASSAASRPRVARRLFALPRAGRASEDMASAGGRPPSLFISSSARAQARAWSGWLWRQRSQARRSSSVTALSCSRISHSAASSSTRGASVDVSNFSALIGMP